MRIVAMDLGKSKTVYCVYDRDSAAHRFGTVRTTPEAVHACLADLEPDRVVLEIGTAAGWVHDLAQASSYDVQVANVNHHAWRWKNVKRKTDRDDALKLAQLSAMGQLPTVYMPSHAVRQKRALVAYRQKLVGRCRQIKNHLRALLEREGIVFAAGKAGWTETQRRELQALALPWEQVTSEEDLWRGMLGEELVSLEQTEAHVAAVTKKLDALGACDARVHLLRTVPAVGARLAETVVAVIDDPSRFQTGKQVGSYVGLTARQYQSGSRDRQGRISGQGHRVLRSLLVEVSWLGLRHNPWMREVYERVLRGDRSRKKIAIVAVARRLLIRLWAMLRDGTVWDDRAGRAQAT